MPASAWPDPDNTTEGVARLQTAFFNVALNGSDQLRQRASFALAQIMVASAVKNTLFEQMVAYQRLMGDYAFGTYRNLLTAITLNPAMGYFLDMVNNVKANPATGTAANENFARESMQLFTSGPGAARFQGNPIIVGGATVPEYDQADVSAMAKVMTGWTYGRDARFCLALDQHAVLLRAHDGLRELSRHHAEDHQPADSLHHSRRRDGRERPERGDRLHFPAVQRGAVRLLPADSTVRDERPFAGICGPGGERIPGLRRAICKP